MEALTIRQVEKAYDELGEELGISQNGDTTLAERLRSLELHRMTIENRSRYTAEQFYTAYQIGRKQVEATDDAKKTAHRILETAFIQYGNAESLVWLIGIIIQEHPDNIDVRVLLELSESLKAAIFFLSDLKIIPQDKEPMMSGLINSAVELDRRMGTDESSKHLSLVQGLKVIRRNQK